MGVANAGYEMTDVLVIGHWHVVTVTGMVIIAEVPGRMAPVQLMVVVE